LKEEFVREQDRLRWETEKKKLSLYEKRAKAIENIPRFWAVAVRIGKNGSGSCRTTTPCPCPKGEGFR